MKFDFIDENRNDRFSCLNSVDLRTLLSEINDYYLDYRTTLNLSDDIQFGVEIEYEKVSLSKVDNFVFCNMDGWKSEEDSSIIFGGEVISPILKDNLDSWNNLRKICKFLLGKNADTLHNASGHIHVGACILGDDIEAWRQFLKLYMAYESVFFRFSYGDKINARKQIIRYASPSSSMIYDLLPIINRTKKISNVKNYGLPSGYSSALNFCYVKFNDLEDKVGKNTLEFRSFNGTVNEIIWQNNINTCAKMLMASKDKVMDEEFLDYKLKYEYIEYFKNKPMYSEVNLKYALEFVDLVFDNNLDKVYFLKQYLKNFQSGYRLNETVYAKKLTR